MSDVKMHPVNSSAISAIGHDGDDCMIVMYSSGRTYQFAGISYGEYMCIRESASVGKALASCGVRGSEI